MINTATTWMDLRNVRLSKKPDTYCMFPFILSIRTGKMKQAVVIEIRQVVDWGGGGELTVKGHEGTFWNDANVLYELL